MPPQRQVEIVDVGSVDIFGFGGLEDTLYRLYRAYGDGIFQIDSTQVN